MNSGTPFQPDLRHNFGKGDTSESSLGVGDRWKFTGREWDSGINFQYNRGRYYDPKTGRWTSADPLGFGAGDCNLYRYVANGPTLYIDPTGELFWIPVALIAAGFWLATPGAAQAPPPGDHNWHKPPAFDPPGFLVGASIGLVAGTASVAIEAAVGAGAGPALRIINKVPRIARANLSRIAIRTINRLRFNFSALYRGFSPSQIIRGWAPGQKDLLFRWWGRGARGARLAGPLPQGLNVQTLAGYHEIARRAILAGIDAGGTQLARIVLIERALARIIQNWR
jgi:RHS repeat-associated protein